jgi:hypothetical protein
VREEAREGGREGDEGSREGDIAVTYSQSLTTEQRANSTQAAKKERYNRTTVQPLQRRLGLEYDIVTINTIKTSDLQIEM